MHGSPASHVLLGLCALAAVAAWWRLHRRSRLPPGRSQPRLSWPERGVAVYPSTIAHAGDGLFATRDFCEGEVVAEYYGEVLSFAKMALRENRDYIMGGCGLNAYVDAAHCHSCPGRYVNDTFDAGQRNARFRKDASSRRAAVVATRAVRAGEEIFASCARSPRAFASWNALLPYSRGHGSRLYCYLAQMERITGCNGASIR
jgi:hypothetical protein